MWAKSSEFDGLAGPVRPPFALLYFPCLAWVCGILMFSAVDWAKFFYFPLAYVVLLVYSQKATRTWQDWLNPLSLIIIIGFVRFSVPGFLSLLGVEANVEIYQLMGLRNRDWILGHALALMGLLGITTGWLVRLDLLDVALRRIRLLRLPFSGFVPYAALASMLVGLAALSVFVGSHASIEEAIYTGEIRRSEIQIGTGKYFYLSLLLIAGSVVFSAHLAAKGRIWWLALIPAVLAAGSFFVLGGRARAFVPVAAGILLLQYRNHRFVMPARFTLPLGILLLVVFSYLGQIYRGLGVEGIKQLWSLSSLAEYLEYAVWVDWGQLHSMAAAVAIGPGVLGGQTFLGMLWPLTKIITLPTRSAGVFMVDTLVPFDQFKWGFHATLIGDAYLNFGLAGVLLVTIVFGMIVKRLYVLMRRGVINKAVYALMAVYSIRIFFESIEKFSEMLVVVIFAVAVLEASRLFGIPDSRGT